MKMVLFVCRLIYQKLPCRPPRGRNSKMQFTEKEIELAKQLKKSGLLWNPETGDWFLHRGNLYIVKDIGRDYVEAIRSYPYENDSLYAIEFSTWLPLWHQCREYLCNLDWWIGEHYDSTNKGKVSLWIGKRTTPGFGTNIKYTGDTDLEVMYQVLLKLLNIPAQAGNDIPILI